MSQTLKVNNFAETNVIETTQLNADADVAATNLTVNFSEDLAADDYLLIGSFGSEGSELVQVASVTDADTIVVSALTKPHNRFDPITKLFGNQIKIYRAANVDGTQPADGSFAVLATIDIDTDQMQTPHTDSTGSDSYWYKYTYFNETSDAETNLADSMAVRSANNYASIESIRHKAGLDGNRWIKDATIDEKRQVAQNVINSTLRGMYTVPFASPINPIIKEVTQLLAAGYLLTQEQTSAAARAKGEALLKQATNDQGTGLLDKLNKKELVLTGLTGDAEVSSDAGGYNAWPNGTTATADADVGGGERKFRTTDRY